MAFRNALVVLAAIAHTTLVRAGGFVGSCDDFSLNTNDGPALFRARCADGHGGQKYTSEDLNLCLGNANGHVQFHNG